MSDSHVLTQPCSQVLISNPLFSGCYAVHYLFFNLYVLNTLGDGCSPINEVITHFPFVLPPSVKKISDIICENFISDKAVCNMF